MGTPGYAASEFGRTTFGTYRLWGRHFFKWEQGGEDDDGHSQNDQVYTWIVATHPPCFPAFTTMPCDRLTGKLQRNRDNLLRRGFETRELRSGEVVDIQGSTQTLPESTVAIEVNMSHDASGISPEDFSLLREFATKGCSSIIYAFVDGSDCANSPVPSSSQWAPIT